MISKHSLHGPINGLYQFATQRFSPCLFRRGTGVSNLPPYILVGLLSRRSHQHLSITLSSNLSWNIHVENIVDKAGKRVDIMVYPKYRLDCSSLETIYDPFIRPILEYGDIMLSNMTEEQTTLIEQLNKTAGRIISRTTRGTGSAAIYNELLWLSTAERRKQHRLCTFHKTIKKRCRTNISGSVYQDVHTKFLLERIPARTSQYFNSFCPLIVR